MRPLPLALTLLLLLPGCTDALGIGGECGIQMASVRGQYGPPDDTQEGASSEIWFYDATPQRGRFTYEFSWRSGECETSGPNPYHLAPLDPPLLLHTPSPSAGGST